jgi:probable F420-dependent oxidoreductase
MEFGLLMSESIDEMATQCAVAEDLGYASVFVGHHRFTPGFSRFGAHPLVVLSAVAERTERIRLGTSIHLLPTQHPLDVAEEFASLDVLSNGRLIFGPGLGYRQYEYDPVERPYHERGALFSECLEVVQRVWAEESVSYHGKYFHFDDVTLTPRPVQAPRPPIWVGANSDAGMRRAARLADGWIVGFADRLPRLAPRLAEYRALAAENGRSSQVCLMRLVGIGASRDDVEQDWLPGVLDMLRGYRRAQAPAETNDAQADRMRAAGRGQASLTDLGDDMFIAGTPEDCIRSIQRCVDETACDHILVSVGGSDPRAALRLFAREVIPAFA